MSFVRSTQPMVRAALDALAGPTYLRIVELLRQQVREGLLKTGDPLPSQRELAKQLGINFTTVTRAYDEARRQGLVQSRHGQGTFIAGENEMARSGVELPLGNKSQSPADLTSIWPPNLEVAAALAAEVRYLTHDRAFDFLARRGGSTPPMDLTAGETWLQPRFSDALTGRVSMASGTRNALIALLSTLVGTGGTLLVEAMIWPTVRTVASVLGIRLLPVELDEQGLVPQALDRVVKDSHATVLYCAPTVQNPTGAVMGLQRRRALIAVAKRHGLTLIEDDAYGALQTAPPPLFGVLAPQMTYSIFGLAKLISPSMRVSYVVSPDAQKSERLADVLRATMQAAPPLEAALATRLIRHGALASWMDKIRAEARERQKLAKQLLSALAVTVPDEGLFVWLTLPEQWGAAEFAARLREEGVLVVPSKAFAADPTQQVPNAVRVATGAIATRQELAEALWRIHSLLQQNASLLNSLD